MKTIDAQWRRRGRLQQLGAFGFIIGLVAAIAAGFIFAPDELPMLRPQQVAGRHFIPAWMLEGVELQRPRTRCSRFAPVRGAAGSECGGFGSSAAYVPIFQFAPASGVGMGTACGVCSNLCPYPEDFESWNAGGTTIANNSASCPLAPDGTRTMALVTFSGGAGNGPFTSFTVTDGATVTHSVYVSKSTGGAACSLHLADGYTGGGDTSISVPASPTRFTMTKTITGTQTSPYINEVTPGDCTDACLWGAQTDLGSSALAYVPMPKGTKGEPLTFTRASTAYCIKAGDTSGILAGDAVLCAYGQTRVLPGGDGTGGVGLGVWAANTSSRINDLLRSQEFDNVAWLNTEFAGAAAPIVTANAATSPDGTVDAERIQFPANTAAQYSLLYQSFATATRSCGIYVRGHGGTSGSIYLLDGAGRCTPCAYVGGSYTRCLDENVAGRAYFFFGTDGLDCGALTQPAADIDAWQADCNEGVRLGPPILTTGTETTMASETAAFNALSVAAARPTGSVAATTIGPMAASNEAYVLLFNPMSEPLLYTRYVNQDVVFGMEVYGSASLSRDAAGPNRIVGWWNATNTAVISNGVQALSAPGTYAGRTMTSLTIGAGVFGGVIKDVCWDSQETYCR